MRTSTLSYALLILLSALLVGVSSAAAQQTQCAEVEVQIVQELTFERQAFDARMRINNGLANTPLQQVNVELIFTDESGALVTATTNPNSTSETFFYRVETLTGISDVSGNGTVQPSSFAEIHWLIIPTFGAAGGNPQGARYFIGARLTYVAAGEPQEVIVTPDFVTVRPQPRLELDYFLPIDVRADDPLTTPIEPPVPFTLGVRITNTGLAPSNSTRIESSQPQITANTSGLLVNFQITGSFIDEEPAQPTLLLDFGSIDPATSRVGRWVMESTLSGQFISFTASWSHSDLLGGRLTSLLAAVRAHRLIRDVIVDLPGRDSVRDFLALQEGTGITRLFESSGVDSSVTTYSNLSLGTLGTSGAITTHYVDVPAGAGTIHVKIPDPYQGAKAVWRIVRQGDSRVLPEPNGWFSVEGTGPTTGYYLNFFDVQAGGRYHIEVRDPFQGPAAPVLTFIPNYLVVEGQSLSFLVQASDPNGTTPQLSVDALPLGASFVDHQNGTGTFNWPTTVGQNGHYPVTFRASDGALSSARTPTLRIASLADTDDDGMLDAWEMQHFGNLNRDGSGDFDGDGLSDLEEFRRNTDPTFAANAPGIPFIDTPINTHHVPVFTPTLRVLNRPHGVQVPDIEFELFADPEYRTQVGQTAIVPESSGSTTEWIVPAPLLENTWYYWRVRAVLPGGASPWNYARFFVNRQNHAPPAPEVIFPQVGEAFDSFQPRFTVRNVADPDGDELLYAFGVLATVQGQVQLFFGRDLRPGSDGTTSWTANLPPNAQGPFTWSVIAYDPSQAVGQVPWTQFKIDTSGEAPGALTLLSPGHEETVTTQQVTLLAKGVIDPGGSALKYHLDLDTAPSFSSPALQHTVVSSTGLDVQAQFGGLLDDTVYYWRVRPFNGNYFGPWQQSRFRVNLANQAPSLVGALNPIANGRADTLSPTLEVLPANDPELQPLQYHWEVYSEAALQNLVASGSSNQPRWTVSNPLINHTTYFWRYRAEDPQHALSPWSDAERMLVTQDQTADPPHIRATAPRATHSQEADLPFALEWADIDTDSNAQVRFYLNNTLLNVTFPEDPDGEGDVWRFTPNSLPPGLYNVNVAIYDGTTEHRDTQCCSVTITAPSTTRDSDGDGVPDLSDNCPYRFNPSQQDSGGLLSSTPDGIGDACQCGDVSGDGEVNDKDLYYLTEGLNPSTDIPIEHPELCNIAGSPRCEEEDSTALAEHIASAQPIPQNCEAALR